LGFWWGSEIVLALPHREGGAEHRVLPGLRLTVELSAVHQLADPMELEFGIVHVTFELEAT